MKRIKLTSPFTGIAFEASKFEDGTILAYHPLTNSEIRLEYDPETNTYTIDAALLAHVKTHTLSECASRLNVTVQRVSNLTAIGTLASKNLPNGDKVVLDDELKRYSRNRKNGRPRKQD